MTSWFKVLSSFNVFVSWDRTRLRKGATAETQTLGVIATATRMIEIDNYIKSSIVDHSTNANAQTLAIKLDNRCQMKIVIAHSVFEWFVDIYDENGLQIYSNWCDHYDDKDENLKIQMKESIEEYIRNVIGHRNKVIRGKKLKDSLFCIYKNEAWVEPTC